MPSLKRRFALQKPLITGRRGHACFWDKNRVYVVGGLVANNQATDSVEVWDPRKRTSAWTELEPLGQKFYGGSPVLWKNHLPSLIAEGRVYSLKEGAWVEMEMGTKVIVENRYPVAIVTKLDWICL